MTFNGRATYDDSIHTGIAEDVSDLVGIISPTATPLLNALTPPDAPATNVYHEWLWEKLNPDTVSTSTALGSVTSASSLTIHDGAYAAAPHLQVGAVLVTPTGEYIQVTAISGNDITFSRAQGGTSATSLAAGATLDVISDAALEGADVSEDPSQPRRRKNNYCQIFKKDIIVSGTLQAQKQLGNYGDEFGVQVERRLTEAMRDLEKAVIRGKSFGNTLGSATAYRTMDGLLAQITTNTSSVQTLTTALLNAIVKQCWESGGEPDLIVCDSTFKEQIDLFNNTRVQVGNFEATYRDSVSVYSSTYGQQRVMLTHWMPASTLMVIDTRRVHVTPLQGRSFFTKRTADTGDSLKGMVLGEYTLEVHNEEGMAKASAS